MANPNSIPAEKGAAAGETNAPFPACPGPIGSTARRLLIEGESAGQVLAVVTGAVYLRTDGDQVLWLTPAGRAASAAYQHARALACEYEGRAPGPGTPVHSRHGILRLDGLPALDLREAALWSPRRVTPETAAPRHVARARAARLAGSLPSPAGGESRPAGLEAAAADIARACAAHDMAGAVRQCGELVGLGPGLTPAGDDFVGGLLFAAWHLQQTYPGCVTWDGPATESLLRRARTATNAISSVILGDLAAGDGPACLHDLLLALTAAEDDGGAMEQEQAARLRQLGSSTGPEMLAGALTGMLLLSDPVN